MTKSDEPILARIVSVILHPLFMTVYVVCLLFLYTDFRFIFGGQFLRFIAPVLFLSCIIPAVGIFFLKRAGVVSDYELRDKSQRLLPYLITALCYALLFYYFLKAGLYIWFLATIAGPLFLLIIGAIVTIFWKISAHMMGIGGLIGSIMSVCYNVKSLNPYILFIILFILAGCLGVSRLMLKRHTPAQVYIGFIAGFAMSYLSVWISVNGLSFILKFF